MLLTMFTCDRRRSLLAFRKTRNRCESHSSSVVATSKFSRVFTCRNYTRLVILVIRSQATKCCLLLEFPPTSDYLNWVLSLNAPLVLWWQALTTVESGVLGSIPTSGKNCYWVFPLEISQTRKARKAVGPAPDISPVVSDYYPIGLWELGKR